ncbi:glycosyltransferase family 39 protein [Domibacillus sp. DTU_2020_1001157_1_SI_ALB_TIR_016]|uniref:glycosyltransferase family 39 protein n=1 Tax=Domibacillus sp. DTU_2020_1001157_1_SI_ALB_TIR_016 TaxID=3077789 RepID=UPI0028EAB03C|nr:glycosyltransferase family 39 protein [Domibacillus sp. DTU_2020_1001157_1_SI_ALB_TIR_016]WNS81476.1 glycosyltransferase family 39 protein [Domibacillus sp. DTU_2020_1001157_1_SI_ALB_TIR_016]
MKKRFDPWLASILALSAILNFYNIGSSGSNSYYTAAVKSMTTNWKSFFYASLDSGNFITVDKPPVALWVQAISAKIFGVSDWSVLLPEAIAGVLSVFVLYTIVKPVFGVKTARWAGLVLAVTPIFVAVTRTNNTDAMLILTLLFAVWALMKSVQQKKFSWLLLSMVLIGIGFNIKMLQAYMVVPAFYLFYLIAAQHNWKKRIVHLIIATVVLLGVSVSYATAVQLTPEENRPYIGGSQTNSVLELAFGYNGIQRLTGDQSKSGGTDDKSGSLLNNNSSQGAGGEDIGEAGVLRLFSDSMSGQSSWLLPFVLFGLIGMAVSIKRQRALTMQHKFAIFWLAWLLPMMGFFSIASFYHRYYLSMMGPAVAALTAIGGAVLWGLYKEKKNWSRLLFPIALLATFAFEAYVLYQNIDSIQPWLIGGVLALGLIVCILLILTTKYAHHVRTAAMLGLLLMPAYWAVIPVMAGTTNSIMPTAGPATAGGPGGGVFADRGMAMAADGERPEMPEGMEMPQDGEMPDGMEPPDGTDENSSDGRGGSMGREMSEELISYLEENNTGETYLVAVQNANSAASIILDTDHTALAMGGFGGSDPAMTVEKLEEMTASGEVKFFMTSGGGPGGGQNSEVTEWIQEHCKEVTSDDWSGLYVYEGA